ncbi:MAG TPA: branched-chain amino acid ABC transporter permease [Bacillales bacterium]|nr:branched-chain amino acid ABC transporter permease [Bacillales bacterium]
METILQVLVNSLMLGFVYVIVALGLSLIFGILDIVNFAQGGLLILGSYITYFSWSVIGGPPFISIILAILVLMVVGIILYYGYLQFIPGSDSMRQIFALIGFSIILENLIMIIFGPESHTMNTTIGFLKIGPVQINEAYLYAAVLSVILVALTFFILYKTSLGTKIRAVADNPTAAGIVGINQSRIYFIALSIGFMLTGAAGGIITTYYTITPTGGLPFVIIAFTAVVLGGLGNLTGTIIGSFIVAFVQNATPIYLSPELNYVVIFLVFLAIVVFRPQGIMGGKI